MPDYQIKNKLANLILFFKVRLNQQFSTRHQTHNLNLFILKSIKNKVLRPGSLDNPSSVLNLFVQKKFLDCDVDVDLVRSCSSKSRLEMESIEGKRHLLLLQHLYQANHFGLLFSNYITCCLVAEMVLFWLPKLMGSNEL